MPTLARLLAQGEAKLAAAGIESPRREARRVLAGVLRLDEATLVARPETALSEEQAQAAVVALAKRGAGYPLSRILGRREFWSLEFEVTAAVLDPRPDSETLIEAALGETADRQAPLKILDLGTGSGCLLLALLSELPRAAGLGVDLSEPALEVAWRNAEALGLGARAAFRQGDWGEGLEGPFDIVLCNPPYVSEAEYRALSDTEAAQDPRLALVPGEIWREGFQASGLEAYEGVLPDLPRLLAPGGRAYFEIGWRQAQAASDLARRAGFQAPRILPDLAGRPRCLALRAN